MKHSFEEQINLLREIDVSILSDYWHMRYDYDKEFNLKIFKLKYAHPWNDLDEKLFEEILEQEYSKFVIQPAHKRGDLLDAAKIVLEFNETIQLDMI